VGEGERRGDGRCGCGVTRWERIGVGKVYEREQASIGIARARPCDQSFEDLYRDVGDHVGQQCRDSHAPLRAAGDHPERDEHGGACAAEVCHQSVQTATRAEGSEGANAS